ncbi:hypothetical protein KCO_13412 [Pectobacterium brasiliense ICMP 19477]|nr:hypothetical protein KCO_13412 [Pectobacterium brasiliense ICMP 19477]
MTSIIPSKKPKLQVDNLGEIRILANPDALRENVVYVYVLDQNDHFGFAALHAKVLHGVQGGADCSFLSNSR